MYLMVDQLTADAIQKLQQDSFMQFMLDSSKVVEEMEHKLHCEVLVEEERDINGQKMLVPVYKNKFGLKPMLSEWGINQVLNKINITLSVATATGNISEEQVAKLSQLAYQDMLLLFSLNYEKCGFESEAIMDSLAHDISMIIFTHLSKSKDGNFVRQMQSSYSYNEIRDGKPPKENKQTSMTI